MSIRSPRLLWLWVYGLCTFFCSLIIWVEALPYLATISSSVVNLILTAVSLFFIVVVVSVFMIARPRRMIVRAVIAVLLVSIALGEAVYFSPYWVLIHMKVSLDRNDAPTLCQYIDFESVRASVKSEFFASVRKKYRRQSGRQRSRYFLKAAAGMAAINAIVTPGGLKAILEGATPYDMQLMQDRKLSLDKAKEHIYSATVQYEYDYDFPNSFMLKVRNIAVGGHSGAAFLMRRSGPFSWKLVSLSLKVD